MEALVLLGVAVLGLALVGLITVLGAVFGGRRSVKSAPLTDAAKLEVAHEVLVRFFGKRVPPDVMHELALLRGVAEPIAAPVRAAWEPTASEHAAIDARPDAAMTTDAIVLLAGGVAARAIDAIAPEVAGVVPDDRDLVLAPEVKRAAAGAHPLARSFLSFENIIFLLAAFLVLGGTLYVVAVTWSRVPGRWQYLFLEGVILFYGLVLAGAALLLEVRLGLGSAARFLSATAGIVIVGAAVVALAAFGQHLPAGAIGSAAAAVAGTIAARIVLRVGGRAPWPAPVFGVALLLLAGTGWPLALGRETLASATLLGAVVVACGVWVRLPALPPVNVLAVAGAIPCAALLLPVADWMTFAATMPALAAAAAITGALGHVVAATPLAFAMIAIHVAALGGAGRTFAGAAAVVALALPVAIATAIRAGASSGPMPRGQREAGRVGAVWTAVMWVVLAALWARGAGLITEAGAGGVAGAWAWTGVAALPFALSCFVVAAQAPSLSVAEVAGWILLAGVTVAALGPLAVASGLAARLGSVAGALGSAALAEGWALRRRGSDRGRQREESLLAPPRLLAAHASAVAAIWIAVGAFAPAVAPLVVATVALALFWARWPSGGRLAGAVVAPVACIAATAPPGASRAWLAAVAAGYGLVHLLRPLLVALPPGAAVGHPTSGPAGDRPAIRTASLGPPALIAALWCALFYSTAGTPALLPWARWPLVLAGALVPLVGWTVWYGGPRFAGIEALAGLALVALGGQAQLALGLACALLCGRRPGVVVLAAPAVVIAAVAAMVQQAPPEPLAVCLLLAGIVFVRRPLEPGWGWLRWLGPPALAVAPMVALFYVGARDTGHLRLVWWPLALAGVLAPFAVFLLGRQRSGTAARTTIVRRQLLIAAPLAVVAALLDAFTHPPASRAAVLAASGAVALLPLGLAAAHREGAVARRLGWIVALALAPIAIVPMAASATRDPAAVVAVVAALGLGIVSRRLRATDVGAAALVTGYGAALWGLAVAARHLSTGGSPLRILPAASAVTAACGVLVVIDARRLICVAPGFVRGAVTTLVALAALFIAAGTLLFGAPAGPDVVMSLGALLILGAFALVVAFRYRLGWPFLIAETVIAAGFEYARFRTSWFADGDWQAVAAAAVGFLNFAAERALRRTRDRLGVRESRILATLFPLLSAVFVVSADPRAIVGMGLSATLFGLMAVLRMGDLYGWLAALLANLALVRVWITAGVVAPFAYAAPPALALMLLVHLYQARLGRHAAVLRTLASLLLFASTSYQAFQFHSVWPALDMAAGAVAIVLLGIHTRARAYLYVGFGALLLDIIVNLTRWGMRDRLTGGVLGVSAGTLLFAAGVVLARHKDRVLARYRRMQGWNW